MTQPKIIFNLQGREDTKLEANNRYKKIEQVAKKETKNNNSAAIRLMIDAYEPK